MQLPRQQPDRGQRLTTVDEDSGATTIDVLANDTDPDGGPKTITSKTNGSHGTVTITNGGADLTYPPDANYCGSDTFTYTLNGGSTATVSVEVTCVDDNPTAVNDSKTVDEDSGATTIDVLANDTDPDGGPKTITSKTNGSHGTVTITNGGADLTYTPDANYCGSDTFTYTLNGGSTATVSVEVTTALPEGTDATKPTITINASLRRRPLLALRRSPSPSCNVRLSCADADSGIASCVGTVADGAPFDRTSTGTKTFTVTATDNAGNTRPRPSPTASSASPD